MANQEEITDSDGPIVDDNIIRIQLKKPSQKKWELRTRNLSPGIRFPTIQLFDCDGNLLVETNDENISIKSATADDRTLRTTQSLKETGYRHVINKNSIKKHETISGGNVYTRLYRVTGNKNDSDDSAANYIVQNNNSVFNIPKQLHIDHTNSIEYNSGDTSIQPSDVFSDISSYKSSDSDEDSTQYVTSRAGTLLVTADEELTPGRRCRLDSKTKATDIIKTDSTVSPIINQLSVDISKIVNNSESLMKSPPIQKSKSFHTFDKRSQVREVQEVLPRSKSGIVYYPPQNKVSFLNTYLKSLPGRISVNPGWCASSHHNTQPTQKPMLTPEIPDSPKLLQGITSQFCNTVISTSDNDSFNVPTDVAAAAEMKKRLKIYRRGLSELDSNQHKTSISTRNRRYSASDLLSSSNTSSSESIDEADVILNRLRRRILKNKHRARRNCDGEAFQSKWRNLRDNYTRDLRKNEKNRRKGTEKIKDYKHSKLLSFLYKPIIKKLYHNFRIVEEESDSSYMDDPVCLTNIDDTEQVCNTKEELTENPVDTENIGLNENMLSGTNHLYPNPSLYSEACNSLTLDDWTNQRFEERSNVEAQPKEQPMIKEENNLTPNNIEIQKSNLSTVNVPSSILSDNNDDDLSFYASTLPMVRLFSPEQKMRYRIEVMNLVLKYYKLKDCQ